MPDNGFVDECRRDDAQVGLALYHCLLEQQGLHQPSRDDDGLAGNTHYVRDHRPDIDTDPQLDLDRITVNAVVLLEGRG